MGKTARWFRGLLGGKKAESRPPTVSDSKPAKEKKKWRFVRSFRDKDLTTQPTLVVGDERTGSYREGLCSSSSYVDGLEQNKHAIAVAAATAAVAEAAVAAAQAAAAVVKLTSSGRSVYGSRVDVRREDWAAIKIQAAFRGYLARRALRALKGLVKLQALVRGHIVRKQAAETLRCMHSLVRVQARARAGRVQVSENSHSNKGSLSYPGPATPEKHESSIYAKSSNSHSPPTLKRNTSKPNSTDTVDLHKMHVGWKWLDRWMDERNWGHREDEKDDKILEIDTGKPLLNVMRRATDLQFSHSTLLPDKNSHSFATAPDSPSKDSTTAQLSIPSPSSVEMQSLRPVRFPIDVEDAAFRTANNSPQFFSASSRPGSAKKGPFTPSMSDARSIFSGYSDHPNYMANTESSRAKVRSQSAPKQRLEFEKSRSTKRVSSVYGSATLRAKFTSKAYPGSGRLDRLGMPIQG